jgi:hypothetical protein
MVLGGAAGGGVGALPGITVSLRGLRPLGMVILLSSRTAVRGGVYYVSRFAPRGASADAPAVPICDLSGLTMTSPACPAVADDSFVASERSC